MATINYIVNVIDRATRNLDQMARSAERAHIMLDTLEQTAEHLNRTLAAQDAAARGAADALNKVARAAATNAAAQRTATAATNNGTQATRRLYFGWLGLFQLIQGKIPLFEGLAKKMNIRGWHLLADAILEVAAVWIPAAIAATAWGVAASDAIREVTTHFKDMHTIMDATNGTIPPMTRNLEKMHNAVRPQVYQLLGDGLKLTASRAGLFNTVVQQTGQSLIELGRRLTMALLNTSTFDKFMRAAPKDLHLLGDSIISLFGILDSLLKAVPGYAEILLQFGAALLRIIEIATQALEPVIALGLAVHGFLVWVGLAWTVLYKLRGPLLALTGWARGVGIALTALVMNFMATAKAAGVMAAVMQLLGRVTPFGWVVIAAAAIVGLVLWINHAKDATEKWVASLQDLVKNADIAVAAVMIMRAQDAVIVRLAQSNIALDRAQKSVTQSQKTGTIVTKAQAAALDTAQHKTDVLTSAQRQLNDESKLYHYRLNLLAKAYGGTANASGLLIAAGITTKQMLDKSASSLAQIQFQVSSYVKGLKAAGVSNGALGNALQVMDRQASDQYVAVQKLNQAWDTFIGDVTSGQDSFDTFSLGMLTLHHNFMSASAAIQQTTHSINGLKLRGSLAGATMDGLSQASLTVNQAFTASVTNANALIDAWRKAGIGGGLFARGVKDLIGTMVRYARGSRSATAELVALAQEAGYKGPASLKVLTKWLGNTHDAMRTVQSITHQATLQEALLTGSMDDQANMIANRLIKEIDIAILQYNNVSTAARNYGRAIAEDGRQSDAARSARKKLIDDLIKTGKTAGESKTAIAGMIAKVLGIPASRALRIVMTGDATYSVKALSGSNTGPGRVQKHPGGARGMFVQGGRPGHDDVTVNAMKGEVIVPTHMVNAGAVNHLRGKIPNFGTGGMVMQGDVGAVTGNAALSMYSRFEKAFTAATVKAMTRSLKAAEAAALSGGVGADVARYALGFGGAPYVLGGASPRGWDCSGFTAWVYKHFGLMPGPQGTRFGTSESQFAWAKKTPRPEVGGLVFFNDGVFANPGHVGIITSPTMYMSAHSPAMGTSESRMSGAVGYGIPPGKTVGGFESGTPQGGGHGLPGGGNAAANRALGMQEASQFGWGSGPSWHDLDMLWTHESGWRNTAQNPTSTAYGIPQFLDSTWATVGGHKTSNPGQQILYGLRYIQRRYLDPERAWAHEQAFNWYGNGTTGAKPGWAWVGEHGRELVNFHGGEEVKSASESAMATHGYVSGTGPVGGSGGPAGRHHGGHGPTALEIRLANAIISYFKHPLEHNTAQNWGELKTFLRDIRRYYSGATAKRMEALVTRQVQHLNDMKNRLDAINRKIAAARQYQGQVQSNLQQGFQLSGLTLGGSMVGSRHLTGAQSLNQQLQSRLKNVRRFGSVIKRLAAAHVDSDLIRQVVDLGPDSGTQFGEEILAGGPAAIKALNATERAIRKATGEVSRGAASAVYEGRYNTGKNFLKELMKQQAGLEKLMARLGKVLGEEAARWFHTGGERMHPGPPGRPARHRMHPGVSGMNSLGRLDYGDAGGDDAMVNATTHGHKGPLIAFGGDMVVREEADVLLLAQKLGFTVSAYGLGA